MISGIHGPFPHPWIYINSRMPNGCERLPRPYFCLLGDAWSQGRHVRFWFQRFLMDARLRSSHFFPPFFATSFLVAIHTHSSGRRIVETQSVFVGGSLYTTGE